MPIKKDGMLFEVHPTPIKGKDGKNIVYARPAEKAKLTSATHATKRCNMLAYNIFWVQEITNIAQLVGRRAALAGDVVPHGLVDIGRDVQRAAVADHEGRLACTRSARQYDSLYVTHRQKTFMPA